MSQRTPAKDSRKELAAGLQCRREELDRAIIARVQAIDPPNADSDSEYSEGLRTAITAAIDHTLEAATRYDGRSLTIPPPILAQAQLAARRRVPLETVLRRYLAGHSVLGDFIAEEAERRAVPPDVLRQVLRSQAAQTDQVVATISTVYVREEQSARPVSVQERRAERVRRLLAGELLDLADLPYDFDGWHLGLVASGTGATAALARLAESLGLQALPVQADGSAWIWLGSRRPVDASSLQRCLSADWWPSEVIAGVGEPAQGTAGWRLTHRQAQAALSVARARGEAVTRYADAPMLASILKDDLLAASLRLLYLDPLKTEKDDGAASKETLRAYFAARQNMSAAAAVLGVNRNTVASRLRAIEDRLGRSLDSCGAELLAALRLEELEDPHQAL